MTRKIAKAVILLATLIAVLYLTPPGLSDGYSLSYKIIGDPDGSAEYTLNVAVPQSLYEYYREKSHKQIFIEDFAIFVTPNALKPIANKLLEIYQNDEESFANGVLMIVHQIPYTATQPPKYPIETLVENSGDCDLFSYVAASIMKAGGLDVVLLYYEKQAHMNIGVHLSHAPKDARTPAFYVTHKGVRYYIAECTGEGLEGGWRVGECPQDLRHKEAYIITLKNCEKWSPGQVSASYAPLSPSTITLTASATFVFQGSSVTFSGQLSPNMQNKTVTIYVKIGGSPWNMLATVTTDFNGAFTYVLNANEAGSYYIRASWFGDSNYTGADSPIITVTVLSGFFIAFLVVIIAIICAGTVAYLMTRQGYSGVEEAKIPEIPPLK
ncbi:MAG: Ig-like domain-containing protein [Nitrososphaerota archaeon]|nr:Ig-like domain-containing protein [Nitrososphaerota archaeon]